MPFSANEEYIIRDRFQYISFINIAQNMNISEGFLELQLGTVDLAFLALVAEISESDLDKTHELLLHGFLLTKRTYSDYAVVLTQCSGKPCDPGRKQIY